MSKEIERKFIVDQTKLPSLGKGVRIRQGYILNSPEKVVRVRTSDFGGSSTWGYITVKGPNEGMTRDEFEYDIPFEEANEMLDKLCPRVLEKTRYDLVYENVDWEIDFFEGQTLVLGEVELRNESDDIPIPEWAEKEVTDDPRFYNSNLIKEFFKVANEDLNHLIRKAKDSI